jgi:hypothetical protein
MSAKASVGAYIRTWGFRTKGGPRYVAPSRLRGLIARRHVDDGGAALLVAPGLQVIGHGRDAKLKLGKGVSLRENVRLMFEG